MERLSDPAIQTAAFQEATDRLQGLRESEVPYPHGYDAGIDPDPARQAEAAERAFRVNEITRIEWEGPAVLSGSPTINPDQGLVLDGRHEPTHPLRKGNIRQGNEATGSANKLRQPR